MTLIKSISGIRGTIGGKASHNFTPIDIVLFTSAFAEWVKLNHLHHDILTVVVGRDARISGEMVHALVVNTLVACGINVIDIGLATTPTTEMAVIAEQAQGGIIITASHNPKEWNALKLLNKYGEFISQCDGEQIIRLSQQADMCFASVDRLGKIEKKDYLNYHIQKILELPLVLKEEIAQKKFKIIVDTINSVGAIAIPPLLSALGVEQTTILNGNPDGHFSHNPEPLDEYLTDIKRKVKEHNADLGIVVDPDVDRLVFVCEDGTLFGEEYTLVAIADYVLQHYKEGVVVSNLSSSRALIDIAQKHGGKCYQAAVGEVNVVELMKKTQAILGGEGNGGIIVPQLHYGRDALVGIALFLSHLSIANKKISELRNEYPSYVMIKHKIEWHQNTDFSEIKEKLKEKLCAQSFNEMDGIRADFERSWIHCRPSNTEPIIRLYVEAPSQQEANELLNIVQSIIQSIC
ncbi:MAG: phosphoglucosamine mutase [Bacteroidales bacterium]|nr:phosphoglucosamine mutase [Bacteroidales bacterium]